MRRRGNALQGPTGALHMGRSLQMTRDRAVPPVMLVSFVAYKVQLDDIWIYSEVVGARQNVLLCIFLNVYCC